MLVDTVKKPINGGPASEGNVFLACKDYKNNLTFSRCIHLWDLVLKSCHDINKGKWIQIAFIFALLVKIVSSFVGMSLLYLWVTFQVEDFSYCNFARRLKMVSKTEFTSKMLTLEVLVIIYLGSLALCLNGLNCRKNAQVWYYSDDIKDFQYLV